MIGRGYNPLTTDKKHQRQKSLMLFIVWYSWVELTPGICKNQNIQPHYSSSDDFFMAENLQISKNICTFAPVIHQPAIEPEHRSQAHCTDTVLGDYCVIIV